MRFIPTLLLSVFLTSPAWAAAAAGSEGVPQLRGLLSAEGERLFSLVAPGGAAPKWVKLGGTFDGWELTDFKAADESLTLKKDGRTVVLKLEGSSIAAAAAGASGRKATLAEAEEVFRKMDFERTISRMLDQQKASMVNLTRQMVPAAGVDREEMAAFQAKTMDAIFAAMNLPELKNDMVKAYSETFTSEELRGLSDFYGTPAGQAMVEKQPEVSAKLNALMTPRLMAAMPKLQQMAQEFAAEQAAKRRAARGGQVPDLAPAGK